MVEPTYVRTAAKAIIIENEAVLAVKYRNEGKIYYTLPGGGQHPGETLAEAMVRECLEEIDVHVDVHDICFIREYLSNNHEFADAHRAHHQVDCCFRVTMRPGQTPGLGSEPDTRQIGVEWLPLRDLKTKALYPVAFRSMLPTVLGQPELVYLGDVN